MPDFDARDEDVGGHHGSGNVRHAADHDGEQLAFGEAGEERTNGQRSFGLAHENAGRDVQGFGAAGAHNALHHHRHRLHDDLHDAEIVEHREERRDEDDDRQHLERENYAELVVFDAELVAENEGASRRGVVEQMIDAVARGDESARRSEFSGPEMRSRIAGRVPTGSRGA